MGGGGGVGGPGAGGRGPGAGGRGPGAGGRAPRAPPLDPPLDTENCNFGAHEFSVKFVNPKIQLKHRSEESRKDVDGTRRGSNWRPPAYKAAH